MNALTTAGRSLFEAAIRTARNLPPSQSPVAGKPAAPIASRGSSPPSQSPAKPRKPRARDISTLPGFAAATADALAALGYPGWRFVADDDAESWRTKWTHAYLVGPVPDSLPPELAATVNRSPRNLRLSDLPRLAIHPNETGYTYGRYDESDRRGPIPLPDRGRNGNPLRIVAACQWPVAVSYQSPEVRDVTSSITVAASRGPDALACDIARRMLPDYLPAWQAALARRDAHNRRIAARDGMARRLAAAIGTRPHDYSPAKFSGHLLTADQSAGNSFSSPGEIYVAGEITDSERGTAELTLRNLSEAQALAVLDVLKPPHNRS